MAARKKPEPNAGAQSPVLQWVAAGLGFVLVLVVVGYSVWEAVAGDHGPPDLSVVAELATSSAFGHTVPIVVKNDSHATAASVEVVGVLEQAGISIEERRAAFAYVPGKGEATGGLVFENDPARHTLKVSVEGYEEP